MTRTISIIVTVSDENCDLALTDVADMYGSLKEAFKSDKDFTFWHSLDGVTLLKG